MSNLKILPVKKLKQPKSKKKIDSILPQPPFLCCLSAGVASGKTVVLLNAVYRFYPKYFEQIFWISPSVHNDLTTWPIRKDETITMMSENLENIDQIILGIIEQQQEDEERDGKMDDILIILDDCLGYLRAKGVERIFGKFRHWKLSFFICVQNFRALPVTARYNCQYWLIWQLNSKKELAKITEEMEQTFPNFLQYYNEGTKKDYSFIYCDMRKQIIRERFDGPILYQK